MSPLRNLGIVAPIYVTRKTSDGMIAEYSLSLWMSLLALLLVWVNVVFWGVVGTIKAVEVLL